jgi:hypothetical protein
VRAAARIWNEQLFIGFPRRIHPNVQKLTLVIVDMNNAVVPPMRKWWAAHGDRYDKIRKIALNYMSIQASNVATERTFSLFKHVMQDRPASLSDRHVNAVVTGVSR